MTIQTPSVTRRNLIGNTAD